MLILAATTAASTPQQKAAPACPAGIILVSIGVMPEGPVREPLLTPTNKQDAKGPAVLTPECKPERDKKKYYPMA